MKKELLTIVAVLLVVAFCAADITSWTGKTPAQLSGMQDYATIPNTAYWNTHAYLQIYDILQTMTGLQSILSVKDTTDLAAVSDVLGAIRYLAAYDSAGTTGEGLVVLCDSTLAEGAVAFNAASTGWQWVRYEYISRGVIFTAWFDSLRACAFQNTDTCVTNTIYAEPNKTETITETYSEIYLASNTHLIMPPSYKIDRYKTTGGLHGGSLFVLDSVKNVIIEGGELDGHAANNGHQNEHMHAIVITACENIIIRNVNIHDWSGDGIYIQDSRNVVIENCTISIPNIYWNPAPHLLVGRECITIVNNAPTAWGADSTVKDIFILGNNLTGGEPCTIDIEPNVPGFMDNIQVIGNTFRSDNYLTGNNGRGISVVAGNDCYVTNVTVAHNFFKGQSFNAIEVVGENNNRFNNINIESNQIDSVWTYGMYIAGAENVSIKDNLISNVFSPDTTSSIGILVANGSEDIIIDHNRFKNIGQYGIFVDRNENTIVRNNFFRNCGWYAGVANDFCAISVSASDSVRVIGNIVTSDSLHQNLGIVCANSNYLHAFDNDISGCASRNDVWYYNCINSTLGINIFADTLNYGDLEAHFASGSGAATPNSTFMILSGTPGDSIPQWDTGLVDGEIHANHGISYGVPWTDRGFLRLSAGGQVDSTRKAGIDINAYSDEAEQSNVIHLKPRGTSVLSAYSDCVILPAGVILGGSWTVGTDSMQIDSAKVTGGKLKFYIGGKIYAISEEAM